MFHIILGGFVIHTAYLHTCGFCCLIGVQIIIQEQNIFYSGIHFFDGTYIDLGICLSSVKIVAGPYIVKQLPQAKQMLVDTPFTVTAIAEECGFSSVYHFCRAFRQRTGKTPTQYAAENRTYQL